MDSFSFPNEPRRIISDQFLTSPLKYVMACSLLIGSLHYCSLCGKQFDEVRVPSVIECFHFVCIDCIFDKPSNESRITYCGHCKEVRFVLETKAAGEVQESFDDILSVLIKRKSFVDSEIINCIRQEYICNIAIAKVKLVADNLKDQLNNSSVVEICGILKQFTLPAEAQPLCNDQVQHLLRDLQDIRKTQEIEIFASRLAIDIIFDAYHSILSSELADLEEVEILLLNSML